MATVIVVAMVLGILLAQFLPSDLFRLGRDAPGGVTSHAGHEHADETLWTCSMHPSVMEDEAGACPICGMDLVPMRGGDAIPVPEPSADHQHGDETLWTCSMHPSVMEDEAGACPICGMDLVPISGGGATAAHGDSAPVAAGPSIHIDPTVVQQMNVRTEAVTRQDLTKEIRTVGYLEFDQQRMVTVTTKYAGWIEKVYVNYVGEKVQKNQPLFEIYAPELVQTEQELLSALRFAKELEDAPADTRQRAEPMVESARLRLGYWDISREQIDRLESTGEVFRTLEVRAPASGQVMMRMPGLEGMAVKPGMELFHIADLSSLWLSVELFEEQLAWVHEGSRAQISLSYRPDETLQGVVRFLEPELSEQTRTMRAKIEVPNPKGELRKGMYATVELQPLLVEQAIVVPSQAVLRTGDRHVVVLAQGNGNFEPREVTLGHETGGWVQVLDGVEVGDEVVTSAQFLLDSESSLRQSIAKRVAERR